MAIATTGDFPLSDTSSAPTPQQPGDRFYREPADIHLTATDSTDRRALRELCQAVASRDTADDGSSMYVEMGTLRAFVRFYDRVSIGAESSEVPAGLDYAAIERKMFEQSRRMSCAKIATRMNPEGSTAAHLIKDAQDVYNWIMMDEEARQREVMNDAGEGYALVPIEQATNDFAWLIEFPGPKYYGSDGEELGVTADHEKALRFARQEDALTVIDDIAWTEANAVQHAWPKP